MRSDHNDLIAHLSEVPNEVLEAVLVAGDVGEGRGLHEEGDAAGPRAGVAVLQEGRGLLLVVPDIHVLGRPPQQHRGGGGGGGGGGRTWKVALAMAAMQAGRPRGGRLQRGVGRAWRQRRL